MKLSGHSYDNNVFQSLLNGIKGDVVYTKVAQTNTKKTETPSIGFSSVTEENFRLIQEEELQAIAGELEFAADRARVAIAREDLIVFANEAKSQNLRGKALERAAQKFCSKLGHKTAAPIGDTRNSYSSSLLENAGNSSVIPAGYNTQYGQNETTTAGYMGMSKNPNTIWDSDALTAQAQIVTGDEKIKASKEAKEQFVKDQKQQYWDAIQTKMGDPEVIQSKAASVANISTRESAGNQNLAANSMSIFSDKRDFENIPEQTIGETLKEASKDRSMKKEAAKQEWDKSEPAKKVDNTASALFSQPEFEAEEVIQKVNNHRASIDRLFDGLTGK